MTAILFLLLFLILLPHNVNAHSSMGYPMPYSSYACKGDTNWCKTPCPPLSRHGKAPARNSPKNPSATWKRGQSVTITWHKNNHRGGFYRRSLVPVLHMWSHEWHKKTAFDYGCWAQGTFQCGRKTTLCGDDLKGRAYRNSITIPNVYPDGDYVFAQVWYGGLHWQGKYPKYSDYWSCAFVRIEGGAMTASYKPKFRPAPKPRNGIENGKCETGSVRPLECGGEACEKKKPKMTVPEEFANGKSPILKRDIFTKKDMGSRRMNDAPSITTEKAVQANNADRREDAKVAREQSMAQKKEQQKKNAAKHKKKAVKPRKGRTNRNPILKLSVEENGKVAGSVYPGGKKMVYVRNYKLQLAADLGKVRPKEVFFDLPGVGRRRELRYPYNFPLKGTPRNKWLKVTVTATLRNGQKYTRSFQINLKSGGKKVAAPRGMVKRRTKAKTLRCSKQNIPPSPTGSWGVTYSPRWTRKRNQMVARREYCQSCPGICPRK